MRPPAPSLILALALLIVGLLLWLRPASPPSETDPAPETTPAPGRTSPAPGVTLLPIAEEAALLNSPDRSPEDDLATLELLLQTYRRHHGGNPVGENVEITAALTGENDKRAGYLPSAGPFLDAEGRLIDRWGTPYFFHSLAADRTVIRSAGPDREHRTADDLFLGAPD